MHKCNYKNLRLSFNKFHNFELKDMPEHGEFCLLELKDGRYTGGEWWPNHDNGVHNVISGKFIRGTADTVQPEEVARWHSLDQDDLTNCLENEKVNWINLGEEGEGIYSIQFQDFKSTRDGDYPKKEQYCLLILMNGRLGAGRWNPWRNKEGGTFIYAPALAQHTEERVWVWTALSPDQSFIMEEERERERKHEEELNKNPSIDQEKFKYGMDIDVYYEKALEKLREEYYWASMAQMKKETPWEIVPFHGKYVFGQPGTDFFGSRTVKEWTEGDTADEFIDFLCGYTRKSVQNSNPEEKFKFGLDIAVYLEKAYENVKKDYRWINKEMIEKAVHYAIKKVDGDWEFVRDYSGDGDYSVCDYSSAEDFIKDVEYTYESAALNANPVVAEYAVRFENVDLGGWYLERYVFSKLKTGDYKVNVQAGNRSTGGGREFFITPYCFEADSYDEFLDRYLEIVPGGAFGLFKEDLLPNEELKSFLGY